ncbi:uncharacterized protein JCM6883_007057 [Sporobolomyces salmoneus]|uniref:uncharacterized protein n=1 Tax=Sporobolomyces salmoneus TaxID=183962 RepID=UPI00316DF8D3
MSSSTLPIEQEARVARTTSLLPTSTPKPLSFHRSTSPSSTSRPLFVQRSPSPQDQPLFPLPPASAFLAGAVAGAASRTVVSPLERLKIILQVQGSSAQYKGVIHGLTKMWKEEGLRGYMAGNGINVIRIAPYSAVQFSSYEFFKSGLISTSSDHKMDTPRRLFAGALAGMAAVVSTYPLDLVRSRLSVESASLGMKEGRRDGKSTGIWKMTLKVYREEGGIRALYRGLVPTSMGVAPYCAFNFASYELLKQQWTRLTGNEPHTPGNLACGAIAGAFSQTMTYPMDLLRRRMQMVGLKSDALGYQYTGSWNAIKTIVQREGLKGLYRGIVPNLCKCAPAMSVQFGAYEFTKDLMDRFTEKKHGEYTES